MCGACGAVSVRCFGSRGARGAVFRDARDLVCMCVCVRALKEKRVELSMPNLVHTYAMIGPRHELTLTVMKCVAGMGMHVDTRFLVSIIRRDFSHLFVFYMF